MTGEGRDISKLFIFIARSSLLVTALFLSSCASSRYETLPESSYAVASWYGPDFHGRPTSSGEVFNMHANTCAHREFPFGTRLRVTNVSNNRAVECIVNDRGPFVSGRDLDLSYAAAKEIGMIGTGTGRVLIENIGRDGTYVKRVKFQTAERTGPFAIQVGSFTESVNAVRLKRALSLQYGNVYIQETEIKGATWYRVRIGNFSDLNSTVPTAEKLSEEGYPALVTKADVKI